MAADADGHNVSVVLGLPEGCALQTPVIVQLVDLATGSAMAGADYAALAVDASVTFPVGAVNGDVQTAGIVVTDDALVEGSETIILGLGTVSGNGVAGSTRKHTITVTDDDLPMLTLADVAQVEGHAGTSTMVFRLTLDQPSYLPVTVQYETLDGDDVDPTENATGGSDFAVKAGTVSLQAGETEVEVLVTVSGDTVVEKDESFYLHLLNVVNATAAPADLMRQGLIINDDGTVPALVLVPTVLNLVEGGIATYDVSFNAAGSVPTGPVTVVMDFDDAQVTVVPATLTFTDADWTTPQTVTVQAISDGIAEGAHQAGIAHLVSSTDPAYNGLAAGDVRVKIAETDVANVLVTAPTGAATEGGATATYDISLVTMPTSDVTITLAADGQSTVNPTVLVFTSLDYATPQTVEVTAVDDALIEGAHQSIITHTASSADPSYNNVVVASATVDIVDNDISTLSLSNPQDVPEGDSGTSLVIFTVTMSPASEQIVTVNYAALDGLSPNPAKNAKLADNDYEFASGMLTFLPGQTTQQILVRINGDTKVEDDERFLLALLTPTNAVLGIALQNITIVNDDAPRITIESVRVDETAGVATLEVEIDKPIATNVGALTVNYTTQDGTAVNGEDYTTTTGQVTFPADGTTQTATINVPITNDTITCEGDEQFTVKLTGSSSGSIVEDTGTVIIADDDAGASLAIDDVSAGEGGIATFTITLTGSCDQPITVAWTTSPGTADASDFTPASAVVTFPAGSPSGSTVAVAITTTADSMHEGDETFFVNLTNPTHATVTDSQGTGTITDDDAAPTLSVSDVTVEEGDAGEVQAVFTVTLTAASGNTVTVNADTADDSATSPADYTPVSQALSFPPGETVRTVMVPVKGDRLFEDAETFKLVLSGNPDIADAEGVCTIALSDVPTITIDAAVAVAEGSAPPAQTDAIFVVRLSNPIAASHAAITLTFATEDGTATAADGDYVAVSTTVTFPNDEGTTVATLADTTVKIEQDITDESNETFNVHITGASAGTIVPGADTRSGTIVNDDGAPQVIATPALVNEPDAGDPPASLDFTVQVVGATSNTVVVNYLTSNNSAEADQDYNAVAGTLFFAPGGPAQTVSVAVLGDDMFELNETFFLVLTSAVNALVATPQVPGAILNNDPEPMLSLSPGVAMVNEANSGTTDALFAVNLDRPSSLPITVNFQTISGLGSATSGVDYLPTQGQVTFPPGSIDTQFFIVPIVGDTLDEGNENFLTTLYQATNALIASPTYITIIVDNDP